MAKEMNYDAEILSARRQLDNFFIRRMRQCNHKPSNRGRVMPLHESKISVPGKKDYPESAVICPTCEKVFESGLYSGQEMTSAQYMIDSAVEQTKMLANLNDEDKAFLDEVYAALDTISKFTVFYDEMVKKLGEKGGNKKGKSTTRKGNLGASRNHYNRGY